MADEPGNEALLAKAKRTQLLNYRPAPFVLSRGEGHHVEDVEGNRYLDLSGGIAVLSVGHCHPKLQRAIAEQAGRLMHVSNLFYNDKAILLAEQIAERTVFDRVYFANSGTEANEALLKLARKHHHSLGDEARIEFVATEKSFHGRSMGALSITGQPKYHVGMEPLVPGVHFVPYNDLSAMDKVVSDRTAAVIVEPVQAEGGIFVPSDEYLQGLRRLCDERGALLLFDEVQTGYGRTGRFLCREWSGVVPDGCSLAKGIGGGFPLAAIAVREAFASSLPPGSHASTFGGNALACAAGLAILEIFDEEGLVERADTVGAFLGTELEKLTALAGVEEARGRGLLRGVALADWVDPRETLAALRAERVLLTLAGGNVLRFAPPLTVSEDALAEGVAAARRVLANAPRKTAAAAE
ncbi:MAG: acetylornithine/succinylornithine family transaminase [Myxococcota bacterium]